MTRDHRRKKAVRALAATTGKSYADAATFLTTPPAGSPAMAARLHDQLVTELERAGWPVQVEHNPQDATLRSYAGPATVEVSRAEEPARGRTGDDHPDDPDVFDLAAPLQVTVCAPMFAELAPELLDRVTGLDGHEIPGDRSVGQIVAEIDQVVGAARRRDVSDTPTRAECGICDDLYPKAGLFEPTPSPVQVCSCCAFDGDLLGPDPAYLAYQLDQATTQDLAMPAGWAGVQVLLCCLGGPNLPEFLDTAWRAAGTVYEPLEYWSDPSMVWIWLPSPSHRPAALAELGCGASLAHITAALDRAYPDLRAAFRTHLDQEITEYLRSDYGDDVDHDIDAARSRDRMRVPDAILDRFWPAAIAYTAAMLTQQDDRSSRRSPWHVLESFELGDWIHALDPDLDTYHVETVLREAIPFIRDTLDPTEHHV